MNRIFGWIAAVCLWLPYVAAHADLPAASEAYQKHDFATAFRGFRELAELGQPKAQYNLAIMYARGEGTDLSNTYAHAWASLAWLNGEAGAEQLVKTLESLLTPTSLRISKEIQSQYDPARLTAKLMPKFLHERDYADRDPVRRLKPYSPAYPLEAQQRGIQGQVYVNFIVGADGRARLPRILFAVPEGMFDRTAREAILKSTFLPARINGVPVGAEATTFVNFTVRGLGKDDYPRLQGLMKHALAKAEAGEVKSQIMYALMISGLPQVHRPFSEALPWFLKAAQAGSSYAQYQVGSALLRGRGCQCDEVKSEVWLEKAAQADQPDAQVTLAVYLLKGTPDAKAIAAARMWLDRAAKSGNKNAKLYLSAILATSPEPSVRDPQSAQKLISEVFKDFDDDPTTWEVRAAAHAAAGNYADAVKVQQSAIDRATKLGWDLKPMQERLAAYQSQHAWTGDLLEL